MKNRKYREYWVIGQLKNSYSQTSKRYASVAWFNSKIMDKISIEIGIDQLNGIGYLNQGNSLFKVAKHKPTLALVLDVCLRERY